MTIRTITGTVEYADGAIPQNSRLEFYLNGVHIDDVTIAHSAVYTPLDETGDITVDLYPNDVGYGADRYNVDLVAYSDSEYIREIRRVNLGKIYVEDIDGQVLQDMLAVFTGPAVPLGVAQAAAISSAVNANIAGEAAIEAVEARDTVVALVEGFDGTFYIDAISGGRGPYAISADPVDARAMLLTLNGIRLIAPDHFEIVTMASTSGVGVLFTEDQVEGMRADYRIVLPTSAAVAADVFRTGNGSPEGVVSADPGTLYMQRDGNRDGTLWVKNAGSAATGWIVMRQKYRAIAAPAVFSAAATVLKEVGNSSNQISAQMTRISLSAGASAYNVDVELSLTNAAAGDFFDFYINLPSADDRTVVFKNGVGGTVLATMFTASSDRYSARFTFNGAAWQASWINQSLFI